MAKSDYLGGAVIFVIMFAIAFASFYVMKTLRASSASRTITSIPMNAANLCEVAGGKWTGYDNPEDPCCYEPTGATAGIPLCLGESAGKLRQAGIPFP